MAVTIKGKTYEVRELTFADSRALSIILDKTNFDLKDFNKDVKGKRLTEDQVKALALDVMAEIVGHLIRHYHKAHREARDLLASLIGVSGDEFDSFPITAPISIVKELGKTINLKVFFESAAG